MMQIPNRKSNYKPAHNHDAPILLRWWHLSSLDAPTVALVWLLAFAWAARITLPIWIQLVLVCGTWGVYLLDRILDACSALQFNQASHLRQRHIFHWRFRNLLFPMAICLLAFAIALAITQMPVTARVRNTLLMAAAIFYFSVVHARAVGLASAKFAIFRNFKELFVALIFTAACTLPTFARVQSFTELIFPALLFAALAWLNCHAIELWESRTQLRNNSILIAAIVLALVATALAIYSAQVNQRFAALDFAVLYSALLFALLHICRRSFSTLTLRIAADLVLLAPLPLLFRSLHS